MTRQLAIENVGKRLKPPVSYIRLRGRWLVAAGFHPGKRVEVKKVAGGILQLTALPEG
jgi:hypothetical protein